MRNRQAFQACRFYLHPIHDALYINSTDIALGYKIRLYTKEEPEAPIHKLLFRIVDGCYLAEILLTAPSRNPPSHQKTVYIFSFGHKKTRPITSRVRVKQKLAMLKLVFHQLLLIYSFICCCF